MARTMRTLLGDGGYVTVQLPEKSTVDFLVSAKNVVNFELDLLIEQATSDLESSAGYADAEYLSWLASTKEQP